MKKLLFSIVLVFDSFFSIAGNPVDKRKDFFEQNKRQWPEQVKYTYDFHGGRIFLESTAFTFVLANQEDLSGAYHHAHQHPADAAQEIIHQHSYKLRFLNASSEGDIIPLKRQKSYRNYFIGRDSSRWSSSLGLYEGLHYRGLYPGIDLQVQSYQGKFKYDVIINPHADPGAVLMDYQGVEGLSVTKEGSLLIQTSVGDLSEQIPEAWQMINGKKVPVLCRYHLEGFRVGFDFPEGFDPSKELVIDPILEAATYSGSSQTHMGYISTNDQQGNLITVGMAFGPGYPITPGAFQTNFPNAGAMVISKFTPDASSLIYATYLSGTSIAFPFSLMVDQNDRLTIFGTTSAADFPVTANCFDSVLTNGDYDFFLSRLNSSGTNLLASTFFGGSGYEFANNLAVNSYGEGFRGDILVDSVGNVYGAAQTGSTDFPVTPNAYDNSYNGGLQDGVVFKFNSTFSNLLYSSYIGGSADEVCYSVKVNAAGDLYVVGATSSTNFPSTTGAYMPTFQGGSQDGFLLKLTNGGSTLAASTFFGTNNPDFASYLDLDPSGLPVIAGYTGTALPFDSDCYGKPGTKNFIAGFNSNLSARTFFSTFGNLDTLAPSQFIYSGFMVDYCGNIFVSGWSNVTSFYEVTPDAMQSTTDGKDFYLMVLGQQASSLVYATYFGAFDTLSFGEHTDGGSSHFDKRGIITQVICQSAANMPLTPNAFSSVNNSVSYDVAVFKIDFQTTSSAVISVSPSDSVCTAQEILFSSLGSQGGSVWDFGDGSPPFTGSVASHIYSTPGTYQVRLVIQDSLQCVLVDTAFVSITVLQGFSQTEFLGPDTIYCGSPNATLNAIGASEWLWNTGDTVSSIQVSNSGLYFVTLDPGSFCSVTDTVSITFLKNPELGADSSLCQGNSVTLSVNQQGNYLWNTGATTPSISVSATGSYIVTFSQGNCVLRDTINLNFTPLPMVNLGPDRTICPGSNFTLDAGNPGADYLWSGGQTQQVISVSSEGIFSVVVTQNECPGVDSIYVEFSNDVPLVDLGPDLLIDGAVDVLLDAGQASTWLWSNAASTQTIRVTTPGTYFVIAANSEGCSDSDTIVIARTETLPFGQSYNVFTPNGDGRNDFFVLKTLDFREVNVDIFDRWGNKVVEFKQQDIPKGQSTLQVWDGRDPGGSLQSNGVYYYLINAKGYDEKLYPSSGFVHLNY